MFDVIVGTYLMVQSERNGSGVVPTWGEGGKYGDISKITEVNKCRP